MEALEVMSRCGRALDPVLHWIARDESCLLGLVVGLYRATPFPCPRRINGVLAAYLYLFIFSQKMGIHISCVSRITRLYADTADFEVLVLFRLWLTMLLIGQVLFLFIYLRQLHWLCITYIMFIFFGKTTCWSYFLPDLNCLWNRLCF